MARPTKYTPETTAKIFDALRSGDTNDIAAAKAGINIDTFYEWLKSKPEFSEGVKRSRAEYQEWELNGILADAKKSLKTLIVGCEYEEVKTEYEQDPHDPTAPRIKKQTRTTKKVLPNATAVIFALCNRDPEHWQNRVSNELSGKIETEAKTDVSLARVPDELLAQVIDSINGK